MYVSPRHRSITRCWELTLQCVFVSPGLGNRQYFITINKNRSDYNYRATHIVATEFVLTYKLETLPFAVTCMTYLIEYNKSKYLCHKAQGRSRTKSIQWPKRNQFNKKKDKNGKEKIIKRVSDIGISSSWLDFHIRNRISGWAFKTPFRPAGSRWIGRRKSRDVEFSACLNPKSLN